MVDNRSAGFFGVSGAFNFKSGNISGTAANTQDDKMGPGTEYGEIPDKEEDSYQYQQPFVDRSAQLRATLNSLAMMNVANVLNEKKRLEILEEIEKSKEKEKEEQHDDQDEEFLNDFDDLNEENEEEAEENEYY